MSGKDFIALCSPSAVLCNEREFHAKKSNFAWFGLFSRYQCLIPLFLVNVKFCQPFKCKQTCFCEKQQYFFLAAFTHSIDFSPLISWLCTCSSFIAGNKESILPITDGGEWKYGMYFTESFVHQLQFGQNYFWLKHIPWESNFSFAYFSLNSPGSLLKAR